MRYRGWLPNSTPVEGCGKRKPWVSTCFNMFQPSKGGPGFRKNPPFISFGSKQWLLYLNNSGFYMWFSLTCSVFLGLLPLYPQCKRLTMENHHGHGKIHYFDWAIWPFSWHWHFEVEKHETYTTLQQQHFPWLGLDKIIPAKIEQCHLMSQMKNHEKIMTNDIYIKQNYIYIIWTQGLGPTGLPGLPGYNGWNPLANDKKNCGRKNVSNKLFKISCLDLQKYQKKCPVGTLNASRKQCANLVNMPDWHIWIKRSEIKWRKNFWLSFRHE